MGTTRTQILDQLENQHAATSAQLSRALQVTPADIRHHLGLLKAEGLVEEAGTHLTGGRGRPHKIYRLTATAREDNLAELAKALLSVLRDLEPVKGIPQVSRRLAGGEAQETRSHPGQRLYTAVQRFNELNYQARWEAHADSPHIIFENCPYREILDEHPELCKLDEVILSQLTGFAVEQTAKLQSSPHGVLQCVFVQRPI